MGLQFAQSPSKTQYYFDLAGLCLLYVQLNYTYNANCSIKRFIQFTQRLIINPECDLLRTTDRLAQHIQEWFLSNKPMIPTKNGGYLRAVTFHYKQTTTDTKAR